MKNRNTRLLDLEVDIRNLEQWFNGRKFTLELLYRGSENGFYSNCFRPRVHLRDKILIVAQSEQGKKFGGYTSLTLTDYNSGSNYFIDRDAFVFSLSQQTKHSLKPGGEGNAIHYGSGYVFSFGSGHDFCLADNCNNNTSSYCKLGCSYLLPEGLTYNTDPSKNYLAGEHKFKVQEIEAF